ncbi:ATP-binding protein [Corynebacterium tuberculostearicum]|uniref:ATP-binding protein n=1 Tax=Corynebacterium tuberculostearicum TaxID=38304 RepID=UPI00265CF5E2|nr:AAA family ATPase [Corynebacterium tuberculostearicum]WKE54903.1 AAA family ATPase [Corynebacterium tuberculostearicum]
MESLIETYESEFAQFKEKFPISRVGTGASQQVPTTQWCRLDIENVRRFRGGQSLDLSEDFTLLYAPNGVGKSTVTECLELLKSGDVSRSALSAVSREFNLEKDLPSHGIGIADVSIALVSDSDNGDVNAKFDFNSDNELFRTLPVTIVSRNTIRDTVTSKDKDRFAQFLAIAQVPGLVEHYDDLGMRFESIKRTYNEFKKTVVEFQSNLESLGLQLKDVDVASLNPDIEERRNHLNSIKSESNSQVQLAETMSSLAMRISSLEYVSKPETVARPENPLDSGFPIEVLDEVLKSVSLGEKCPVCRETTLDHSHFARFQQVIEENKSFLIADRAYREFKAAENRYQDFVMSVKNVSRDVQEVFEQGEDSDEQILGLVNRLSELQFDSSADFETLAGKAAALLECRSKNCASEAQRLNEAASRIAAADEIKLKAIWSTLGRDDNEREQKLESFKAADTVQERLKRLEVEKKDYFSEILSTRLEPIREDIIGWWNLLRPVETDFDLSIDFSAETKTPKVRFQCTPVVHDGKKVKPKNAIAIMSDSQLDVLSLAVTIASHCADYPGGLLWLDDPTDMFDEMTQTNFCKEVLPCLVESGNKVVLATHSKRIVETVWDVVAERRLMPDGAESKGKSFGDSILQVNIEAADGPQGEKGCSRFAPFDVNGIKADVEQAIKEVKTSQAQWNVGQRLRIANQIRRYAEAILASLSDVIAQVLADGPYGSSFSLTKNKATLHTYEQCVKSEVNKLRSVYNQTDAQSSLGKLLGNIITKIELGLNDLNYAVLNSGSHASAVIPTLDELEKIKKGMEKKLWPAPRKVNNFEAPGFFISLVEGGEMHARFREAVSVADIK